MEEMVSGKQKTVFIINTCFSGKWAQKVYFAQDKINVVASCQSNEISKDWGLDFGGAFPYLTTHCDCDYEGLFQNSQNPILTSPHAHYQ